MKNNDSKMSWTLCHAIDYHKLISKCKETTQKDRSRSYARNYKVE